jgi:hypothetical protein
MAKFLLMAERAFIDMLKRLNKGKLPQDDLSWRKKGSLPTKTNRREMPLSQVPEHFSTFRENYKDLYQNTTGKAVPAGKVVVPKDLYDRITDFLKGKKGLEGRAKSMTELDRTLVNESSKPGGRPPPEIGEKGSWTFQNPGTMPTFKNSRRSLTKRRINEMRERLLADQRAAEELLAMSGQKAKIVSAEEMELAELQGRLLPSLRELTEPTRFLPRYRPPRSK